MSNAPVNGKENVHGRLFEEELGTFKIPKVPGHENTATAIELAPMDLAQLDEFSRKVYENTIIFGVLRFPRGERPVARALCFLSSIGLDWDASRLRRVEDLPSREFLVDLVSTMERNVALRKFTEALVHHT
ncbi:hypothetical protein Aduo_019054 [Ancylostoma duodenale]